MNIMNFLSIISLIFLLCYIQNYSNSYKVLIFTLYFPIQNHRHSIPTYIHWIYKYFNIVKCDIVFFTDSTLKNILPKSANIKTFYFQNIISIPIVRKLKIDIIVKQKALQIYHSKLALLYYISTIFHANIYFYNDISSFHYKALESLKNIPSPSFIKELFKRINDPILFTICPSRKAKYFIQGGCFGGKRAAIKYLYNKYYSYIFNYYKIRGVLNISDERIYDIIISNVNNAVLMPNNPNKCEIYNDKSVRWFFYLSVLSGYPLECVKNLTLKHLVDY